jgi:general secretion pathway protein G
VEKLPNDPWGHPYQYMNPGIKGEIDVLSFGADGQSGGEGKNADIGSWQ